jgi:hypothetical protein
MSEGTDRGLPPRVTRRRVLVLPLVMGLAACTLPVEENDPDIQVMKKDPMFAWRPPIAATRTINYAARNWSLEPGPYSTVSIVLTPKDLQAVPALLQAAEQARTEAGYTDKNSRFIRSDTAGDYWIHCEIFSVSSIGNAAVDATLDAVRIDLQAPYRQP